jgi:hypothetical protein
LPSHGLAYASIARLLASKVTNENISAILRQTAQDYDGIAEDLESGVVEVRHPDPLRQQR